MEVVTAAQMRALDQVAIQQYHIPSLTLMENAGQSVAAFVKRMIPPSTAPIVVFLGKGNNAGDGLVAARYLIQNGIETWLVPFFPWGELSPDAQQQWERLKPLHPKVFPFSTPSPLVGGANRKTRSGGPGKTVCFEIDSSELAWGEGKIGRAPYFIDALLGTGLAGEVSGVLRQAIDWLNQSDKPVFSIDIPSGLSADTGKPLGAAVQAKYTITFAYPKVGFFLPSAAAFVGKLEILDIGIPKEATKEIKIQMHLTETTDFLSLRRPRDPETHKGSYGNVLVIAGMKEMLGAGYLASLAALRAGAGLVSFAMPAACFQKFNTDCAEIIPIAIPDGGSGFFNLESLAGLRRALEEKTVVVCGPGIGRKLETAALLKQLLPEIEVPLVLDADGIVDLKPRHTLTVLTPHPGEMGKLVGQTTEEIQNDRLKFATETAKRLNATLVLKGHHTITAFSDGTVYINPTGNPGMATAGAGDVLAGCIGGLLGQNFPEREAILGGVYCHGLGGDIAKEERGEKGLIATDILNALPKALWNG